MLEKNDIMYNIISFDGAATSKERRIDKRIFWIIGIGLLGATFFELDGMLLSLYTLLMIKIMYSYSKVTLKYFVFFLSYFWNLLSVYMLDNNVIYLPNLLRTSEHIGATSLLLWSNVVFFATIIFFESRRKKEIERNYIVLANRPQIIHCLYCLTIITLIAFLMDVSRDNFFTSGLLLRQQFYLNSTNFSIKIYHWVYYLTPIVALYAIHNNKTKPIYTFAVLFSIYLLLLGNKFGAFETLAYFILLCYILPRSEIFNKKINFRGIAKFIIIAAVLLLSYSFIQYYIKHGSVLYAFIELINRVANGQGDVWWAVYEYCQTATGSFGGIEEFGDELSALNPDTNDQMKYNFGIYKMMNMIAPVSILQAYADLHNRFSTSTDASIYYYFGTVSLLIFKFVLGIMTYKIINGIVDSVKRNLPISAMLYCYILYIFYDFQSMSGFASFLKSTNLIAIFLLCAITAANMYIKRYKERRMNNDLSR